MFNFKLKAIKVFYKNLIRPVLFLFEPETVHNYTLALGNFLGKYKITRSFISWVFNYNYPQLVQTLHGIKFANPIGLAAGFDKDGKLTQILPSVGFGFSQVGTVTYKPYEGNPQPRLYRLPKSRGIVVYFGLKNIGVKKIINNLKPIKHYFPVSYSVGKTNHKYTANSKAGIQDYYDCLKVLIKANAADFYTINISCPNTFGGEPFTTPDLLNKLLKKLYALKIKKPVFLKMPINTSWKEFKNLLDVAVKYKVSGVIIGNLNKNRQDKLIKDHIPDHVKGSISGKPCKDLSNHLISKTYEHYGKKLTIIGVGGIFSSEDAYEKIKLGASLVQLITGMIYEGPQLIGEINQGVVQLLKQDGFSHISQAIGSGA